MLEADARKSDRFKYVDGEWWYYPPNSHRARAVIGKCQWCGGNFVRTRSAYRTYEYCGNECYRAYRREHRRGECQHCGGEFVRTEYPRDSDGRSSDGQKYCSHECYADANRGEAHVHYRGYVTHDGPYLFYTMSHPEHPGRPVHSVLWHEANPDTPCERCGAAVDHVHHRDGDPSNNALSNLEGLCAPCHISHHAAERAA